MVCAKKNQINDWVLMYTCAFRQSQNDSSECFDIDQDCSIRRKHPLFYGIRRLFRFSTTNHFLFSFYVQCKRLKSRHHQIKALKQILVSISDVQTIIKGIIAHYFNFQRLNLKVVHEDTH